MNKPLHDNLFVEKDKNKEELSPGGIVMPGSDKRPQPDTGTVIAVGPGRKLEDGTMLIPEVKVGDKIILDRFAGHEVLVGMDEILVVPWTRVLGIVE